MEVYTTMFYSQLLSASNHISMQIQSIQQELSAYPPGSISCVKNGNYDKFYYHYNNQTRHLRNQEKSLIDQLMKKKYLSSLLKDLIHEKNCIDSYLKKSESYHSSCSKFFDSNSRYSKYLSTSYHYANSHINEWANASFEQNTRYPEHLIHNTYSGHMVRSKSESLIDSALYLNKIPFRYECKLTLDDITFFPDFTIMHPESGKLFYWEHLGMMDDPVYIQKTFSKLQVYASFGIIPSINLILTSETKDSPFTSLQAEQIIQAYF